MKTWYLKLSHEQRKSLSEEYDTMQSYADKYGLTFETVRDKYAKLLLTEQLFDDATDFYMQLEDSLEKARVLATKRKKTSSNSFIIYNGLITQAMLKHSDIVSGEEEVHFTDCEKYVKHIHWNDILTLSALYKLIENSEDEIDSYDSVTTSIDTLYNTVMQSKNGKATDIFIERARNTISKLRSINGCYTQGKKNHILHSSFFIDSSFDDKGLILLGTGYEYQELCNIQKRIVGIDSHSMSTSETYDEQLLKTYIMWRVAISKNNHNKMGNSIELSTMRCHTGLNLDMNRRLLKTICKQLKVNIDDKKIWWDK